MHLPVRDIQWDLAQSHRDAEQDLHSQEHLPRVAVGLHDGLSEEFAECLCCHDHLPHDDFL